MTARILHGSCLELLAGLDAESVDAIVTDPPYDLTNRVVDFLKCRKCGARGTGGDDACRKCGARGTGGDDACRKCGGELYRQRSGGRGFMGKDWDGTGIAFRVETWEACLRALKPGGHLLAFGGTRTFHRMTVAIEDAGFEIRDCLSWLYGSGFPKSLNVSKAIDRAAGAEREVIGANTWASRGGLVQANTYGAPSRPDATAPATPAALDWDGWGTALKPGWEPIILARKPFRGSVAANVLTHGTGAINVDGCRIGENGGHRIEPTKKGFDAGTVNAFGGHLNSHRSTREEGLGRWPANVLLDDAAAEILDQQTGELITGGPGSPQRELTSRGSQGGGLIGRKAENFALTDLERAGYKDAGGGSRFFKTITWHDARAEMLASQAPGFGAIDAGALRFHYSGRADSAERNAGLDDLPKTKSSHDGYGSIQDRHEWTPSLTANHHPTVKPIDLMRWLVRLITPPGGTVLDPFTGSGSTGCAAVLEGFSFLGCELQAEYVEIAERRIQYWASTIAVDTLPLFGGG